MVLGGSGIIWRIMQRLSGGGFFARGPFVRTPLTPSTAPPILLLIGQSDRFILIDRVLGFQIHGKLSTLLGNGRHYLDP